MSWRAWALAAFLLVDLWLIYQPLSLLHSCLGDFARRAMLPAGNAVDDLRFHFGIVLHSNLLFCQPLAAHPERTSQRLPKPRSAGRGAALLVVS